MTKRIKVLTGIFIVLLAIAIFSLRDRPGIARFTEENIALQDTASIRSIRFGRQGADGYMISRTQDGWVFNNDFQVRNYLVNLIMTGLSRLEVKREVTEATKEQVMLILQQHGFRVRVFGEGGTELQNFLIAKNPNDPNSSYYLGTGAATPVVAHVPGFEGSIANVFELTPSEWRSKTFFSANERTLQKVSIHYPAEPGQDITISYHDGDFKLEELSRVDSARFHNYLPLYSNLTVQAYVENQKDSILRGLERSGPYATLEVQSLTVHRSMDIYRKDPTLYGVIREKDTLLVTLRSDLYEQVLKKRSYFLPR